MDDMFSLPPAPALFIRKIRIYPYKGPYIAIWWVGPPWKTKLFKLSFQPSQTAVAQGIQIKLNGINYEQTSVWSHTFPEGSLTIPYTAYQCRMILLVYLGYIGSYVYKRSRINNYKYRLTIQGDHVHEERTRLQCHYHNSGSNNGQRSGCCSLLRRRPHTSSALMLM